MEQQAAEYRLGLRLGVYSPSEIVAWADKMIAESPEPTMEVIDIALMQGKHPQDFVSKLGVIAKGIDARESIRPVLSAAAVKLQQNPLYGPVLAQGLYDLAVEWGFDIPADLNHMTWFDDAYDLANQGIYGTVADVYKSLLDFTKAFTKAGQS